MCIVDNTLWYELSKFVEKACQGRDESHGHNHMKMVASNALEILQSDYLDEKDEQFYNDVLIVAWLHDVNDHKYDVDGELKKKVEVFIDETLKTTKRSSTTLILNIIERISFSRENKQKLKGLSQDWHQVIGDYGTKIRDIVSDADKIEALGKVGLNRCVECAKEFFLKKHNKTITQDVLEKNVAKHADEKLLLIKDNFIRTAHGKVMAQKAHDEFTTCLNAFLKQKKV